jgi:hypothetical protein
VYNGVHGALESVQFYAPSKSRKAVFKSVEILCRRQEELLPHELESPQAQAAVRSDSSVRRTSLPPSFSVAGPEQTPACWLTPVRVVGQARAGGCSETEKGHWCIGLLAHPSPIPFGASFSTTLLDTLQYVRDNRRKTFMICPIWRELQARFVRAAKAIEENDQRLPGGSERNRAIERSGAGRGAGTWPARAGTRVQAEPRRCCSGRSPAVGRSAAPNQGAQKQIRFVNCVRSRCFLLCRS